MKCVHFGAGNIGRGVLAWSTLLALCSGVSITWHDLPTPGAGSPNTSCVHVVEPVATRVVQRLSAP